MFPKYTDKIMKSKQQQLKQIEACIDKVVKNPS